MGQAENPFKIKHLELKLLATLKQLRSTNRQVEKLSKIKHLDHIVAHRLRINDAQHATSTQVHTQG